MGGLAGGAQGGRSKSKRKRAASALNLFAARKAKKLAAIARARAIVHNNKIQRRITAIFDRKAKRQASGARKEGG